MLNVYVYVNSKLEILAVIQGSCVGISLYMMSKSHDCVPVFICYQLLWFIQVKQMQMQTKQVMLIFVVHGP